MQSALCRCWISAINLRSADTASNWQLKLQQQSLILACNLSFVVFQSGGLLLTEFIKFMGECSRVVIEPAEKKAQVDAAWKSLDSHTKQISALLSQPPLPSLQQHPEEHDALALFT